MKLLLVCLFLSFGHFTSRAEGEQRKAPHPLNFYGGFSQEKQSAPLTTEEARDPSEDEDEEEGEDPSPDEEEIDDPLKFLYSAL